MMSSRIARVVIILTLLATATLLAISVMPVCRTGSAHAAYQESAANITPRISTDNQTAQETDSNRKLAPGVAEKISTLKPTDDIWLEVKLITYEAIGPMGKIIREMTPEARTRLVAAIEALPDTSIVGGIIGGNWTGMLVQTKVGNIEALTEMPEIAAIMSISSNPPMHSSIPIMLLSPNNGSLGCPVDHPSFSWSPYRETTKFKFVLAKDVAMTQVVKEAEVIDKSYDYDGTLDYGTYYYWHVMAVEPEPSDWSATFSFQTEAAPPSAAEAEPQTITWQMAVLVLILIALAISSGLVIWLILAGHRRTKSKPE
jgi:hypothetical protein